MPIFNPDFSAVEASFPIWEKARYRVKVTARTPEVKLGKEVNGVKPTISGVHYKMEIVGRFNDDGTLDTSIAGKPVSRYTIWLHSEGGWQFGKPFLMATNGYNVKAEEADANVNLFQAGDWQMNGDPGDAPENITLGKSWDLAIGKLVDVQMSKKVTTGEDGVARDNQEFNGWAPVVN